MIPEHELIVLTYDLPENRLKVEGVGTVVHVHRDGVAYEVEYLAVHGDTIAVSTVEVEQLWRATGRDFRRA